MTDSEAITKAITQAAIEAARTGVMVIPEGSEGSTRPTTVARQPSMRT